MTDTVIQPKKLSVSITGNGKYGSGVPYPGQYLQNALSQNILWHARKEAKSIEELSTLTGEKYILKLIEDGVLKKEGKNITINIPYYTKDELNLLIKNGSNALADIKDEFRECLKIRNDYYFELVGKEYRKQIIEFDARDFYAICVGLALENGLIDPPKDKTCDVILEY